jgi:NitT/TauT family transport system substrate-binding protein
VLSAVDGEAIVTTDRSRQPRRLWALVALAGLLLACSGGAPAAGTGAAPTRAAGTGAAPSSSPAAAVAAPAPTTAAVAAAAPTTPPQKVTLRMALQDRPDQAHFELAWRRGYLERQGIEIEPITFSTGGEVVQAIATNQLDVGTTAPNASLFNALNRGIDIRMVADWAHLDSATDQTLSIIGRQDLMDSGTLRSMADLRGRVFGVGGLQGGVGDYLLQRALEHDGEAGIDLDVQYLSFADILAGLGNRRLDAGMMTEPLITQVADRGIASVLYPGGAVIPGAHLSLLMFSPPFAASQPDVATRFMIGYLQGARDYYDAFHLHQNREAAIDLLVQHLSVKDRRVWETAAPSSADLNGRISLDDLRAQAAFHQQRGTLTSQVPDLTRYVESRFAEEAVRQIGAR